MTLITDDMKTSPAPTGLMAATLAHEIRNPLASIATNGETLRALLPDGDGRTRYMDSILAEVERLETIVASVLRFSGCKRLATSSVALMRLAVEVLEKVKVRAERQGVQLVVRGAECVTRADRDLVERVLENLVRNALEAMSDGGTLTITVGTRAAGGIAIEVEDTGPGLPHEDPEHVFEPFFTTRTRGMGLGLPLARKIAERHGGRLSARHATHRGAVFLLELPEDDRDD
jgi:two-component system sensor histidine kinase PilS (NtrC family)